MFYRRVCNHLVDHVCPTKRNGRLPRILEKQSIWAILGIGIALFGFSQLLKVTDYLNIGAEVYPTTIVNLTNQDRVSSGLAPLSESPTLEEAANLKVQDMVQNSYFAHVSPEGINPWHWFKQAGYQFVYAGENLAVNFDDSSSVENAWLNSPSHRANIMNANYKEIGVATAKGIYQGMPATFVVQLFGAPAVAPATSSPLVSKTINTPSKTQSASKSSTKISTSIKSAVAGESTFAAEEPVITPQVPVSLIKTNLSNQESIAVENTDPALIKVDPVTISLPKIPLMARLVLNANSYIGLFLELVIIALIMATATIVVREQQRHHRLHMAYGILTTVVLASFLFVGRIGVFAEAASRPVLIIEKTLLQ